jgi:hypothetical protein
MRRPRRRKQHRIAIVISAGPVSRIDDPGSHLWHPFWEELRRLGDIEGQNLTVERYAGNNCAGRADCVDHMTVNIDRLIFSLIVFQNRHISGALAELIRSTRAPTKDRLIGKIMGGNPAFRGMRVPVHLLAELCPRACARARATEGKCCTYRARTLPRRGRNRW